jgi:hypothetical protein
VLGYSGIDRDRVAGPRLVVAAEHVEGDDEGHVGIGGGRQSVRHRAHGAALHAAVAIGGWGRGFGSVVCNVLAMHALMIVPAVTGGPIVMARNVGVLDASCGDRRQLQRRALSPSRRAGDKREREGQNQKMAKNATHYTMLAGPANCRQLIFGSTSCAFRPSSRFAPTADVHGNYSGTRPRDSFWTRQFPTG